MHAFLNTPLQIGSLTIPHRLIQGPLAGYSCAPFRTLFNQYTAPAYCVSEMVSAADVMHRHAKQSRYIYRAPEERCLAYQISGNEPELLAQAAQRLEGYGANLIDINCGCPKAKIRKKGAGSALLDTPERLLQIIRAVRDHIDIPLTIKIRIQDNAQDLYLAEQIAAAGADALIVHGRRWQDDYGVAANFKSLVQIKRTIKIPVIANGDIFDEPSLQKAMEDSACDAYMISRAGTGKPWLYQQLLTAVPISLSFAEKVQLFMQHLHGLARLENEYKAVLQSKSLVRYYFGKQLSDSLLKGFYQLASLAAIEVFLNEHHYGFLSDNVV